MPNKAKDYVQQALVSGSVSSAGHWPKEMADRLRRLYNCPVAQPCNNGFTSLLVSMQAIHVSGGDEVIIPALTMIAVPNAVTFVGGRPVFAESADGDYNPGLKEILQVASDKTRAVVLTHTYGVPTRDLEDIVEECHKRQWILIEDISQCVGVKVRTKSGDHKLLGTFGHFGCASLYANKIIHGGDGGFIVAKNATLMARIKALVNHGFTPNYHFLHFESAINAKMNGLGAALACGCLDRLDQVLDHRHQLAQWYRTHLAKLPDLELMYECGPHDTPWVFGVVCQTKLIRCALRAHLAKHGIETRDYFYPLHLQPAFRHVTNDDHHLPRAEQLGSTGFYLPTYTDLTEPDVQFICQVICNYYKGETIDQANIVTPVVPRNDQLVLKSGTFSLETLSLTRTGQVRQRYTRGHPYIDAIDLHMMANRCLIHESWDVCHRFCQSVDKCLFEAKRMGLDHKPIERYFQPYVDYFKSQSQFEASIQRPWTLDDLTGPEYLATLNVSTTSELETIQLLVWLIKKYRPKCMLELGSWMGYSTLIMAIAGQTYEQTHHKPRIYACDSYIWQKWMSNFVVTKNLMANGDTFLQRFHFNTQTVADYIEPIVTNFDQQLPEQVLQLKPDFVFIDFTQDSNELDRNWEQLEPTLTAGHTIILFNGISIQSIPFLSRHSHQLKALAKPHSIAKAFLYSPDQSPQKPLQNLQLNVKFNFQLAPDWAHHHKNAFNSAIDALRQEFHDKNSEILFIPSIEATICDNPELLRDQPWVGIIHMTPDYPELFYTPDLRRLCSKRYKPYLKLCKGLYTLTKVQNEFLEQNLNTYLDYKIPIQTLVYPFIIPEVAMKSQVIQLLQDYQRVDLILIGGFARNLNLFYQAQVPGQFKKVILINDLTTEYQLAANDSHVKDVELRNRLPDDQYEQQLYRCIPFLSLKHNGAANTLILECIARNVPILVPDLSSCLEYVGKDYPLIYSTATIDFTDLLTEYRIQSAINYLQNMNKSRFKIDHFLESVKNGIVLNSMSSENQMLNSPEIPLKTLQNFNQFDVTVCICSYKRTHHLPAILESLWSGQTFDGKVEIIVWNNNHSRESLVEDICNKYMSQSTPQKSLHLIQSTKNYFCSIRLSLAQLMQSQRLLICDDDCIPGPEFVQFFMSANRRHPRDVLCLRGHKFLEHILDPQNPTKVWLDYEGLRFIDDNKPEQFIHFIHADTCLVPRQALQECGSVPMPDPCFTLVDDYWMSYVLSHKFNRNLRKLFANLNGSTDHIVKRTEDSDEIGLALYTRPEVRQNKIKLYIHHMLQGWPVWDSNTSNDNDFIVLDDKTQELLSTQKRQFWDQMFIGFNISSEISDKDVQDLVAMGVKCVRIGAVGLGDKVDHEFSGFVSTPEDQLRQLKISIALLKANNIKVVLTLKYGISSPEIWQLIAKSLYLEECVVGYDLINEPCTQLEQQFEFLDNEPGFTQLSSQYIEMIQAIRDFDKSTPIIIESSNWANVDQISRLHVDQLLATDTNLILSFHFYEPQLLTNRQKNKNRFTYPGEQPKYEQAKYKQMLIIDDNYITKKLLPAIEWSKKYNLKLVLGEFGISRDIKGAHLYLEAIINVCKTHSLPAFVYSFRDDGWDSMDYELGTDISAGIVRQPLDENILMQTIVNGIKHI